MPPAPQIDRWGAFCQLYVLTLAGVAVALSSRFWLFLDERFTLDADYIQATLRVADVGLRPEDPFRNIALVYRILGLTESPDLAAMLAVAVFGVATFTAIRWHEMTRLTPLGLGLITICYVLALLYIAQYSKEFVSLLLVVAVLLLPAGLWAELAIVVGMALYASTMRPYWGIVAVLYVAGRLLLPRLRGILVPLILVVVAYVGLQLVFNTMLGLPLSHARISVNELRADINISVGSLIVDFLPDAGGLQWLNAFLVFLSLVIPWPLLLGGSPTYLLIAVVLIVLWRLVYVGLRRVQTEHFMAPTGMPAAEAARAPFSERAPRIERSIALLLALVVVQAIFEPDYGSYVKHLTPALPLFIALLPLRGRDRWTFDSVAVPR
ncbi:hypothetical protein ACPW96_00205 [Micromonospora sp. DT81.3]|uniref:hypothetical protein n=1 Tax=Micromonospora sp. DT81.3 TaxID=3416523 RepID=UPI003CF4BBA0